MSNDLKYTLTLWLKCLEFLTRYDECSEDRLNSKLLLKLNCGEFRLCKGLPKEALDSPDAKISQVYIEQLNEGISVRSRDCELAMVEATATCSACTVLAKKLCPEHKPTSSSSEVCVQVKPDLHDGGFEESEEVKYMYVYMFVNHCILYKIWSILNTLNDILNYI